jgi:MFS family permease
MNQPYKVQSYWETHKRRPEDTMSALPERETALPPGTVHLVGSNLDRIILVPKPSSDPDDPLNWSQRRKLLNIGLILFYVLTTGIGGTSVYSVFTPISEETGISIAQLNTGTGFLFLMAGWTNIFWQPMALTFGRRPIILLSLLGCIAVSEWTAWISHYPSWAAARCLYGLVCAPVEVLPQICIPDVFFAHERGTYIGWYMLVLCGSNFLAPLIAGFMNDAYGWHWVQHWSALVLALNFVLAFFFYEESMYTRASVEAENEGDILDSASTDPIDEPVARKKKTFWQKMKLWSFNHNSVSQIIRMGYRPVFIFFLFPNIMWAGIMYGFALAWYAFPSPLSLFSFAFLTDQVQRLQRNYFIHPLGSSLQLLSRHCRSVIRSAADWRRRCRYRLRARC